MDTQPITLVDALAVPRVERLLDFGGAVDQVLDAAMLVMDHFAEVPDNAWPTGRQGLSALARPYSAPQRG